MSRGLCEFKPTTVALYSFVPGEYYLDQEYGQQDDEFFDEEEPVLEEAPEVIVHSVFLRCGNAMTDGQSS